MNFTRYEVGITLLAPAILGGVLGYLVYQGITGEDESSSLLLLCIVGGVLIVSALAYLLRRFLLPKSEKDSLE